MLLFEASHLATLFQLLHDKLTSTTGVRTTSKAFEKAAVRLFDEDTYWKVSKKVQENPFEIPRLILSVDEGELVLTSHGKSFVNQLNDELGIELSDCEILNINKFLSQEHLELLPVMSQPAALRILDGDNEFPPLSSIKDNTVNFSMIQDAVLRHSHSKPSLFGMDFINDPEYYRLYIENMAKCNSADSYDSWLVKEWQRQSKSLTLSRMSWATYIHWKQDNHAYVERTQRAYLQCHSRVRLPELLKNGAGIEFECFSLSDLAELDSEVYESLSGTYKDNSIVGIWRTAKLLPVNFKSKKSYPSPLLVKQSITIGVWVNESWKYVGLADCDTMTFTKQMDAPTKHGIEVACKQTSEEYAAFGDSLLGFIGNQFGNLQGFLKPLNSRTSVSKIGKYRNQFKCDSINQFLLGRMFKAIQYTGPNYEENYVDEGCYIPNIRYPQIFDTSIVVCNEEDYIRLRTSNNWQVSNGSVGLVNMETKYEEAA